MSLSVPPAPMMPMSRFRRTVLVVQVVVLGLLLADAVRDHVRRRAAVDRPGPPPPDALDSAKRTMLAASWAVSLAYHVHVLCGGA